jgi:hypothetical protein
MDRVADSTTPVGLLTGKVSGIVVVDIDVQNGASPEALFARYGDEIKRTRVVKTPSDGWHLYYTYPGGADDLKGVINAGKYIAEIGPGIDFLGDRRHVQAPPTARVGHPSKPDGQYRVINDVEPVEMPTRLLEDWLRIIDGVRPEGVAAERVSPLQYRRMLELHEINVQTAKDAPPGDLDNTFYARLASSMRIAQVIPDSVLSFDEVELAFMDTPYEVKDFDGKVKRAVEFAQAHPWEELQREEFDEDIPDGIAPEDLWEYLLGLRKRRISSAVEDRLKQERIENEAAKVVMPDFKRGDLFLTEDLDDEVWIIDGLLHKQGKALLSAQMKAGKSTMMLNLIKALTTGAPFLGRFDVPKPQTVAFYDMELGRAMAQRWLRDVEGIDGSRLHYVSLLGKGNAVDMRSQSLRTATARRLRELGVDVLIVDPISPVLSPLGLSENDSESIRPLLDSFDMLATEAGLSAVIITAHTGHEATSRARGSAAFGDWPTSLWNLQKAGEAQTAPRTFAAYGRDVDVPRGGLAYHPQTRGYEYDGGRFDKFADPEPWEQWLTEQRGKTLTAAQVQERTGCSDKTAATRLRDTGWVITAEATKGRHATPAEWEWAGIQDPFARMAEPLPA